VDEIHLPSLQSLIARFNKDQEHYESREFNEDETRLTFIDPFLELLGWDLRAAKTGGRKREVLLERPLRRSGSLGNKRPDYTIVLNGRPQFVVEAKAASVALDDARHVFQLKSYAWSLGVPFAILTNFARFRAYDCRFRPEEHRPTAGLINELDITHREYASRWQLLCNLFSRDAVIGGALHHPELHPMLTVQTGRRNQQIAFAALTGFKAFDESFLNDLEHWRKRLADAIFSQHPSVNEATLRFATQRLLDKLIFIRVVEDRNIRRGERLQSIANTWRMHRGSLFDHLYALFDEYYRDFNGVLFRPDPSDSLRFDEMLLEELIDYFYFPRPYRFDAPQLDVLGSIYERFIGRHLVIDRAEHCVRVENTPDTQHLSGVYYTPSFIVDKIVEDTIGARIQGKSPAQILRLRILDPACGSGAFLIGAFKRICDELADYYESHPRLIPSRNGVPDYAAGHLSPIAKAEVVLNCLRGIDKDLQAVEVTVLSLSIAILDERFSEDMAWKPLISALPDLSQVVFCFNTLIDDDYAVFAAKHALQMDADCITFDFTSVRPGSFDVVIGNPPYVRLRNMLAFSQSQAAYIREHYASMAKGNPDLCIAFVERCMAFLKRDGVLEFIISSRFFVQEYGHALRLLLTSRRAVRSIVNFQHHRVFKGLSTYTALLQVSAKPEDSLTYQDSFDLKRVETPFALQRRLTAPTLYPATAISAAAWRLLSDEALRFKNHMDKQGRPLWRPAGKGFCRAFFVGPQTSLDKFFICQVIGEEGNVLVVRSALERTPFRLERTWLRWIISGANTRAYGEPNTDRVIIMPYLSNGSLVDLEDLRHDTALWDYYKRHENALRDREATLNRRPYDDDTWYRWGYPKSTKEQSLPKLVIPGITRRLKAGFDRAGSYVVDNVDVCGITLDDAAGEDVYFYLLALLNTNVLNVYWRIIATPYQNFYFRANKQVSCHLPIANYEPTCGYIQELSRLGRSAYQIASAIELRPDAGRQLSSIQERIDEICNELYRLTPPLLDFVRGYLEAD
jgi:hypothetical protein